MQKTDLTHNNQSDKYEQAVFQLRQMLSENSQESISIKIVHIKTISGPIVGINQAVRQRVSIEIVKEWSRNDCLITIRQPTFPSIYLKEISTFDMKNLQVISLSWSYIHSIQPLCWINAPSLKIIDLHVNMITCIKPFSKCHFNNINQIQLNQNHFQHMDFNYLPRSKFGQETIDAIKLSFHLDQSKKLLQKQPTRMTMREIRIMQASKADRLHFQIQKLKLLVKIQPKYVNSFNINQEKHTNNTLLTKKLYQRFDSNTFYNE